MEVEYSAWLSTNGEHKYMAAGALFSGMVRDVPAMFKHLLDKKESRQYVTIWPDSNR